LSQGKVRGAKRRAYDLGAKRFINLERSLNVRTGLGEIATIARDAGDAEEYLGFSLTIIYITTERQRLVEIVERFLFFSNRIIEGADVAKCRSFTSSIADLSPQPQRLVEMLESLLGFSQRIIGPANVAECRCFSRAIAYSAPERQRLVVIVERF